MASGDGNESDANSEKPQDFGSRFGEGTAPAPAPAALPAVSPRTYAVEDTPLTGGASRASSLSSISELEEASSGVRGATATTTKTSKVKKFKFQNSKKVFLFSVKKIRIRYLLLNSFISSACARACIILGGV